MPSPHATPHILNNQTAPISKTAKPKTTKQLRDGAHTQVSKSTEQTRRQIVRYIKIVVKRLSNQLDILCHDNIVSSHRDDRALFCVTLGDISRMVTGTKNNS